MKIEDHISERLETFFRVKILKFFDADPGSGNRVGKKSYPGSGMEKIRIRDGKNSDPGSASRLRNTAHKSE